MEQHSLQIHFLPWSEWWARKGLRIAGCPATWYEGAKWENLWPERWEQYTHVLRYIQAESQKRRALPVRVIKWRPRDGELPEAPVSLITFSLIEYKSSWSEPNLCWHQLITPTWKVSSYQDVTTYSDPWPGVKAAEWQEHCHLWLETGEVRKGLSGYKQCAWNGGLPVPGKTLPIYSQASPASWAAQLMKSMTMTKAISGSKWGILLLKEGRLELWKIWPLSKILAV